MTTRTAEMITRKKSRKKSKPEFDQELALKCKKLRQAQDHSFYVAHIQKRPEYSDRLLEEEVVKTKWKTHRSTCI